MNAPINRNLRGAYVPPYDLSSPHRRPGRGRRYVGLSYEAVVFCALVLAWTGFLVGFALRAVL